MWNDANRLAATATAPGAACTVSATYTYNGDGLRTKTENYCATAVTTAYNLYDLGAALPVVLAETQGGTNLTRQFTYGGPAGP